MPPQLDETENAHGPVDAGAVQRRLEAIEGSLLAQLTDEQRYGSGVPGQDRSSDLEFIQMTGLTRPFTVSAPPRPAAQDVEPPFHDLDARKPLDFFEQGVADVDHLAGPPGLEPDRSARVPAVPQRSRTEPPVAAGGSKSADALKELIADLTRTETDEVPDAALIPEVVEPPEPMYEARLSTFAAGAAPESEYSPPSSEVPVWESAVAGGKLGVTSQEPSAHYEEPVTLESLLDEAAALPADTPVETLRNDDSLSFMATTDSVDEPPIERRQDTFGYSAKESALSAPERRLAEAEELLQALDRQPRDIPDVPPPRTPAQSHATPGPQEDLEQADEYPDIMRAHKSQRRVYRRSRRHILRKVLAGVCVLMGCAGVYYAYTKYVAPITVSADALYAEAGSLMQQGRYEEAAQEWRLFTQRFPTHGDRAEAQFQAAFAYFLAQPAGDDEARDYARRAMALFEEFMKDNPGHRKAVRAECMIGVLHYRLQQHERAITQLRPLCEPARRGEDPEAILPAMRTLARAYSRTGDYVAAEEMYEAAASLEKNYTPEVDYYELGSLYIERARIAADASEKRQLQGKAVAYWDNALRAPGIDPQERERIRTLRAAIVEQMGAPSAAPAPEAPAPVPAEEQTPEPVTEPAASGAVQEPSPSEEAQQLLRQGAPSS